MSIGIAGRNHDIGNDFEMIERGDGIGDFRLGVFYPFSSYDLYKLDSMRYNYLQDNEPTERNLKKST